ncbi:flavin reductase [Hwanghaeella grinnelliae]|uniref:Flavin reductase n=1 Tax=Hwanghaeella grinnelliae TaxID=2500179 RepID=A0A437QVZ8_9PROT|nr:flavin reductase family protein [Hwanghaeella grinnelliae]RVU38606.1 flavin reductase [Hwanghaeella grinnelliae]
MATRIANPIKDEKRHALRSAFGAFPTGVTVVTARQSDGAPRGFTANSFTSVSLDPPMLLVCIAKSAHSCDVFTNTAYFGVSILKEDQKDASGLFASQRPDKFDIADWFAGRHDVPLISGSLATFTCVRDKAVDAGDHVILVGEVEEYDIDDGRPLGFFRGNYFSLGLEETLVSAAARAQDLTIGAVLQRGDDVLVKIDAHGRFSLPKVTGPEASESHFNKTLVEKGVEPSLDFLYAIYRDNESGAHSIFYHGTVSGSPGAGLTFVGLADFPLEKIENAAERSMLNRYRSEVQHGQFSIYEGTDEVGRVRQVANAALHTR